MDEQTFQGDLTGENAEVIDEGQAGTAPAEGAVTEQPTVEAAEPQGDRFNELLLENQRMREDMNAFMRFVTERTQPPVQETKSELDLFLEGIKDDDPYGNKDVWAKVVKAIQADQRRLAEGYGQQQQTQQRQFAPDPSRDVIIATTERVFSRQHPDYHKAVAILPRTITTEIVNSMPVQEAVEYAYNLAKAMRSMATPNVAPPKPAAKPKVVTLNNIKGGAPTPEDPYPELTNPEGWFRSQMRGIN